MMYTALAIMLCGIIIGRMLRNYLQGAWPGRAVFLSILLLLFLMGLQIGSDASLFSLLPSLGWQALAIAAAAMAGSIACGRLLQACLRRKGCLPHMQNHAR